MRIHALPSALLLIVLACGEEATPPPAGVQVALLAIAPMGFTFDTVRSPCFPGERRYCYENRGSTTLHVQRLEARSDTNPSPFQISAIDGGLDPARIGGAVLDPGARLCLELDYRPTSSGLHAADVVLTVDESSQEFKIPVSAAAEFDDLVVNEFSNGAGLKIDVLLVVDRRPDASALDPMIRDNVARILASLKDLGDIQFGVVHPDASENGQIFPLDPANPDEVLRPQLSPDAPSQAFYSVYAALASFQPFFRPNARLMTIFISSRDDASDGPAALYTGYISARYAALNDFNTGLLGAMFAAFIDDGNTFCFGSVPHTFGQRYLEAVPSAGGIAGSFCSDWSQSLQLGRSNLFQLFLTDLPDPNSIRVEMIYQDMTTEYAGFFYDPSSNSMFFNGSTILPPLGAKIRVSYRRMCR